MINAEGRQQPIARPNRPPIHSENSVEPRIDPIAQVRARISGFEKPIPKQQKVVPVESDRPGTGGTLEWLGAPTTKRIVDGIQDFSADEDHRTKARGCQ